MKGAGLPIEATRPERSSSDDMWRLRHLPSLLTICFAMTVVAAALGGVLRGGAGAAGAALGVAVVTGSYLASTLLIAWADRVNPSLVLPVGMMAYVVKFTILGLGMMAIMASGWAGMVPLAWGVVAGIVAWTAAQIIWVVRHPPRLAYRPPPEADDD